MWWTETKRRRQEKTVVERVRAYVYHLGDLPSMTQFGRRSRGDRFLHTVLRRRITAYSFADVLPAHGAC